MSSSDPRSIAIFTSSFAPHLGGVEELVRQLAAAYRRKQRNVIVVTNRWPRDLPTHEEIEGVSVYRPAFRLPDGSGKAFATYLASTLSVRRSIRRILREHGVDLVHVQCVSSNAFYALDAARALALPLVVTSQGERTMDASAIFSRSRIHNEILRTALTKAQVVTGCSADVVADLERWLEPFVLSDVRVIHNGIAIDDFADRSSARLPVAYILGIGRLVTQKGFDVLIDAFAEARSVGDLALELVIAGEGPEADALTTRAASRGVKDHVRFFGRADRAAAIDLISDATIVALPSRHEPFGIVGLEAMAAGRPLIASNVGGIPEYAHDGHNALLAAPGHATQIASALSRLGRDATLRTRLGMNARQTANKFDWRHISDAYLMAYADAAQLMGNR